MRRLHAVFVLVAAVIGAVAVSAVASAGGPAKPGPGTLPAVQGSRVVNTSTGSEPGTSAGVPTTVGASSQVGPRGWVIVNIGFSNPAGQQTHHSVDCPVGTVAWGGGVGGASGVGQNTNSSYPLVSGGLAVGWQGVENNATGSDSGMSVWAVCAQEPKNYSVQSASTTDAPGIQTHLGVECPKHSLALGGGAAGTSSSLAENINSSYPTKSSWGVDMNNGSGSDSLFTAYAICGKANSVKIIESQAQPNPSGQQSFVAAYCKGKSVETGGGVFSSTIDTAVSMNTTVPHGSATGNGWISYENNASGSDASMNTYVVCVKK
jgi:hypothetical protein